jgi:hypothetical protein
MVGRCALVGLLSDLGRSAPDVANDSAIFDAWRRTHEREHAVVFEACRGTSKSGCFRARFRRHRYRSDARAFDILQGVCDLVLK